MIAGAAHVLARNYLQIAFTRFRVDEHPGGKMQECGPFFVSFQRARSSVVHP
jgi:hypothetical protein